MSKINYVLAKDEDFERVSINSLFYIGKEPYVEIPHVIKGVPITSYENMFSERSFIRGVKSTNKNVINAKQMFYNCKNKRTTLDLSEFDMTGIEHMNSMFQFASFKEIIWPKNKMPLYLKDISGMFSFAVFSKIDLSTFDVSEVADSESFVDKTEADDIIFPKKGLIQLLKTLAFYESLSEIDPKYHTEELCWEAVLADKMNIKHVKIKSKRILMYLGTDCLEYVKFYYSD